MSATPDMGWHVRRMRSRHLDAVMAIEQAAYEIPWSERVFRDCLRVGYRAWVIDRDGLSVAGYALASIAVGEAHLLNLCVAPAMRGQGASDRLLNTVIAQARYERASELFLEVRPSNTPARRLYARYGFDCRGRRPDYYPGKQQREDALLLARPV